jgi:hypothetical protein
MQSFATKDIKYNFMVDTMMIASIDGNFDKSEEAIIEQYFEMFKITEKEAKDLRYIYEMFYTQNGNALYRYFKRNEYMKVELFQYLLDYYKIDMAYELVEDEKKILTFDFFKPTFTSGSLGNGATEIMTKPVNNAQFCIYLNSAFMDKTIEIDGNGKVVDSESKNLLMDLDSSDIEFRDGEFVINTTIDKEKKITGVTYVIANMFIEWVSEFNNTIYKLSSIEKSEHMSMISFNVSLNNEFIYNLFGGYFDVKYSHYVAKTYNNTEIGIGIACSNTSPLKEDNLFKNISFRMIKLPNE